MGVDGCGAIVTMWSELYGLTAGTVMLIQSITRKRFSDLAQYGAGEGFETAAAWFADRDGTTIAVVKAEPDSRWGYVCLSRDGQGSFCSTGMAEGFATRDMATRALCSLASQLG
jgi:hypothetical protein